MIQHPRMKGLPLRLTPGFAIVVLMVLSVFLPGSAPAQTAILSGYVTNSQGQPVPGVDLDFEVAATGDSFPTSSDSTDFSGFYDVTVLVQVYDVIYNPPVGSPYATVVLQSVNLTTNQVRNVVLPDATLVSGTILRGDTGLPLENADIDLIDLSTGLKLATPNDKTDAAGAFSVRVPLGVYDSTVDRNLDGYAAARVTEMSIEGPGTLALGTITLAKGFHLKGELRDDIGDTIVNADLDVFPTGSSVKVFLLDDNTDGAGKFDLIVPPGTYRVQVNPPAGSPYYVRTFTNVNVTSGDADLGLQILSEGKRVQGFVRDSLGAPVAGADLDVTRSSDGAPVPAVQDDTDATGFYRIYLPPGTVDLLYTPERNSLLDGELRPSVGVVANVTLPDVILPYHDTDGDAYADREDRCPFIPDPGQEDLDADGVGDACDNCPSAANGRQENNDTDALGDACDPDDDGDGALDGADPDRDGHMVANLADNCPQARNGDQRDGDDDGAGDACDPDDGVVEDLRSGTPEAWTWRPETGALRYHVYRHPVVWLTSVNYGVCIQDGLEGLVFRDSEIPSVAEGRVFLYLMTAQMPWGEGSLGGRSGGVERPNLRSCP